MNTRKTAEYAARSLLLAAGMFVAASGVAIITQAHLGTTPISTVPLAIAGLTGYSFGTTTFFVNILFVLLQWALLGKYFHATTFFQIPVVFAFSVFIDVAMALFAPLAPESYLACFAVSFFGNAVLAAGIVMQLHARIILQPGEGLVIAETVRFKRPFGTMKIVNDVTLVGLAVLIGLVFSGHLIGVREGTLVSAFMVGIFAKFFLKLWPMPPQPKP